MLLKRQNKMKRLVPILILLSGCGLDRNLPPALIHIDTEMTPYYEEFLDSSFSYGVEVKWPSKLLEVRMATGGSRGGIAGLCMLLKQGYKAVEAVVLIDPVDWGDIGNNQRWNLVLHELAHCLLHRKHNSDTYGGFAESLMYPYVLPENHFLYSTGEKRKAEWNWELYNNIGNWWDRPQPVHVEENQEKLYESDKELLAIDTDIVIKYRDQQ